MFQYLSYDEINKAAFELQGAYAVVESAEKAWNVKPARSKNGVSCTPLIIHISDMASLSSDKQRPQVFISGEIHGDEKIGPLSSVFTAQILVWSAQCEIDKVEAACKTLRELHIEKEHRIWLAYLASRRDIYIIPTANCLGYLAGDRFDAGVDPNRDFAYMRADSKCFHSSTANVIVELFRRTIIQSVVTFHGGTTSIGYEWGSTNHMVPNDKSPDHKAHEQVAKTMSAYGGAFGDVPNYPTETINKIVYPVLGGMEDWMYASGWDRAGLKPCTSPLLSHSSHESNGRAIVFLVETSDQKQPLLATLGKMNKPLENAPTGHVSRNARVVLVSVDSLQPYVCLSKRLAVKKVHNARPRDRKDRDHRQLEETRMFAAANGVEIKVKWYVGGAMAVDSTYLSWHTPAFSWKELYDSRADWFRTLEALESSSSSAVNVTSSHTSGKSRWGFYDPLDPKSFSSVIKVKPWSAENRNNTSSRQDDARVVHVPSEGSYLLAEGDHWLVAWAQVDQIWGANNQGLPTGPPQSHIANARTNPAWRESDAENKRSGGREVRGRVLWPSDPVLLRVDAAGEVALVSQVEDCAWWTRQYHSHADIYSINTKLNTVPQSPPQQRTVLDQSQLQISGKEVHTNDHEGHRGHSSLIHDVFDWDDWVRWASRASYSSTGIIVFFCWLLIFALYIWRCRKKRAYARLKRTDIEIL